MAIRKELKPALPKKKQEASYLVVITATATSVKVAIAGAAVRTAGDNQRTVQRRTAVPANQIAILTESFQDGALIRFEFTPGSFSVNGMATKSPQILLQVRRRCRASRRPRNGASRRRSRHPYRCAPAIANPFDATMGLPLLMAYVHLRKYGLQLYAASKTFADQQVEVDDLLKKADKLLCPLGITRADLERLLDRKTGLV